jgi:cytoskeletal protein RodZ
MLVLAGCLIALVVACGGGDDSTSPGDTKSSAAQTSVAAATSSASAGATSMPSDTSAPTPTPRPTDAAGPGACTATAHVNNQAPPQKFTEIVTGVLTCNGASPEGAKMHTVWHEKSATKTCGGTVDVTGQADCSRMISLTSGFTVVIDVTFSLGDSTYSASASFTPQ